MTSLNQRSRLMTWMIYGIFFVISLLTNIIGPLLPEIIKAYSLSLTMAAFLPFSFFVAYAVMSIPAGVITERKGEKIVLLGAFLLALLGSLLFGLVPLYPTALLSLFLIGLGMAALQVAINPLLRVTGGEENFAFNAVLVQLVFGLASFVSPMLYTRFATGNHDDALTAFFARLAPPTLPWISVYWVFTALTALILIAIAATPFPCVVRNAEERTGALATHLELLRSRTVWAYFVGIFAYVGLEQGLSNWISEFMSAEHGFNPQTGGADTVSHFWLLMTIGAGFGMVLLKFFDSRKVLLAFSALSFVTLGVSLFGPPLAAFIGFPAVGFSISVMWSIVFSLALNSLDKHHGTFSGILCTGIVGGAVVPLLIGAAGDWLGLKAGLCLLFLPLGYIFSMGLWARPLITNKTVGGSK